MAITAIGSVAQIRAPNISAAIRGSGVSAADSSSQVAAPHTPAPSSTPGTASKVMAFQLSASSDSSMCRAAS